MRINKYLASLGIASRREIDRLVDVGLIKVNGKVALAGDKISSQDKIEIEGKKINLSQEKKIERVYFLLNKPEKILSTSKDDRDRKTVIDLIPCEERIFTVGRLDYETSGAIILTNDGELCNKITHPSQEIFKEYIAEIMGTVSDENIEKLETGIQLEDFKTLPAKVEVINRTKNQTVLKISIREGKNRQIRKMIQHIGHRVMKLKREKIGDIELGDLPIGKYRKLTIKEIDYLYSLGG
ncbi:MAG: pseudouridine synthase [Fusobacteriaceae bacterium]